MNPDAHRRSGTPSRPRPRIRSSDHHLGPLNRQRPPHEILRLDTGHIYVRRQAGGRGQDRVTLKTATSERDVPISARLQTAVSDHLRGKKPNERVFVTNTGTPWSGATFATALRGLRKRVLPDTSWHPHCLRHYYASRLILRGMDLVSVSRALGHATPAETASVYARLFPGQSERIRAALAEDAPRCT